MDSHAVDPQPPLPVVVIDERDYASGTLLLDVPDQSASSLPCADDHDPFNVTVGQLAPSQQAGPEPGRAGRATAEHGRDDRD